MSDLQTLTPVRVTMPSGITFAWPTERPHFATVTRVTDGDTIRANIDLNLKAALTDYPVRLAGCNAWEKATEGGKAALAHLTARLPVGTKVVLTTVKDYKYGGEFIANIWLMDGTDLVAELIAAQWLAPWDGKGRGADHVPPWPRTVS